MKKFLACLLCAALLSAAWIPAFAENGPCREHFEEWYPTFLALTVLDGKEQPVVADEWGNYARLPLFENDTAVPQSGAVYDLATNTLTLTDFKDGNYILGANMMGDDFTICLQGENRLSRINVWADGWGGGLRITGDGSLTVNGNKTFESAIVFYPEGAEKTVFTIDPTATVSLSGSVTAFEVYYSDARETVSVDLGDAAAAMVKKNAVRDVNVFLEGYSNPMEENIRLCENKADPTGLYDYSVWYNAQEEIVNVTVARYVLLESLGVYVVDYAWARENATSSEGVSFKTEQEAQAAGFTPLKDNEGEPVWKTVPTLADYSSAERVYEDKNGNRYVVGSGYDENHTFGDIAMTIAPIAELPGLYAFTYAPGVDANALEEVIETKTFDDVFDYTYPETEFTHPGGGETPPAPAFLAGDVNDDGAVGADDARLALRRSVDLEDYAEGSRAFLACDVNGDGNVGADDARHILRASVDLERPEDWIA